MQVIPSLIQAAWIAPIDQPPIRDGAIVFRDGRIVETGPTRVLRTKHPAAETIDLGNSILLPGLVNAHVHLELSDLSRQPLPAGGFVDWLIDLIVRRRDTDVSSAVANGARQCLRFGVTTVGDITGQCALSRAALAKAPMRGISYGEVQAMAQRRGLLDQRLSAAIDTTPHNPRVRVGISPHAPYTIEPHAITACTKTGLPLAMHLAESSEESTFLANHTGAFRDLWETLGWWDNRVSRFVGGPIRMAQSLGLLDMPALLAHVNYCDDDELALLAAGRASVVYCPRTHDYFHHPLHRWRDMLAAGINVAIGTDSTASSPDLNLVDDLRLLHHISPNCTPQSLWELVTLRGARALGMQDEVGSLTPGKFADFVSWKLPDASDDPLQYILESDKLPSRLWTSGQEQSRAQAHSGG